MQLEQNYRSSGNIVGAANGVVRRNTMREAKTLWTRRHEGPLVQVTACRNAACEAALIVHEILKRHRTHPSSSSPLPVSAAAPPTSKAPSRSLAVVTPATLGSGGEAAVEVVQSSPQPVAFRNMAVLFRTNATGALFQEALHRAGVPFKTQADHVYSMLEVEDVPSHLQEVELEGTG